MRIYFPGNSYPGRVSLVTLKCKRHRDAPHDLGHSLPLLSDDGPFRELGGNLPLVLHE